MSHGPLSELRVIHPCPASWDKMAGTDRVRHCKLCDQNVFNISAMTHAEAVDLVRKTEGRVCVRYYQRQDGTVLTRDCSLKDRVSLKARLILTAVAGVLGITLTNGCGATTGDLIADRRRTSSENPHPSSESTSVKKEPISRESGKPTPTEKAGQ